MQRGLFFSSLVADLKILKLERLLTVSKELPSSCVFFFSLLHT